MDAGSATSHLGVQTGHLSMTGTPAAFDRDPLAAGLAEFEEYIATPPAWSDRSMRRFRAFFLTFGVEGLTADDLIAAAKEKLNG